MGYIFERARLSIWQERSVFQILFISEMREELEPFWLHVPMNKVTII